MSSTALPFRQRPNVPRWIVPVGLALATILLRLPWMSRFPFSWDAAQYSLGVGLFSPLDHQPHPPGYPVYTWLGSVLRFVFHDAHRALVVLSILGAATTVVVTFLLAQQIVGRRRAWIPAVLLMTNPFFWYFTEVAAPYVFDGLTLLTLFLLLVRTHRRPSRQEVWLSGLVLAIGTGIRPLSIILFLPVWMLLLVTAVRQRVFRVRGLFILVLCTGIAVATWFVPLLIFSGGWQQYAAAMRELLGQAANGSSVFGSEPLAALWFNVKNVVLGTAEIVNILVAGIVVALLARWRPAKPSSFWIVAALFLFLPPSLLFTFGHLGSFGYLMSVAPVLVFVLALPPCGAPKLRGAVFLALVMASFQIAGFFGAGGPAYQKRFWPLGYTVERIRRVDAMLTGYQEAIRQYDPRTTVILTEKATQYRLTAQAQPVPNGAELFRQLSWILPEYTVIEVMGSHHEWYTTQQHSTIRKMTGDRIPLPVGTTTVLVATDGVDVGCRRRTSMREYRTPDGRPLFAITISEGKETQYCAYRLVSHKGN